MPIPSRGLILFDGAARMETCCGGSGAIAMPHHAPLLAHFLATATTNNIAEYDGLIRALTLTVSMRLTHVEVCGDSNLLMNHLRGLNRVRHSGLRDSYVQARILASTLHCVFAHRPRKFNQAADFLSKQAPDDCCDYGTHAQRRPLSPSNTATFYDFLDLDFLHNPG
ncbi:hypothetical protein DYB26_004479 [Aphanomyces astaci]|uniref:RNase H type-1 domain-containing protein n=1 Tax=Aphanomyces astaci TaxID=112090 RepID=A0A3R6ZVT6_APHAT|nr:hypothetical protein DYB26_004479 [Aphanomyces astaci]